MLSTQPNYQLGTKDNAVEFVSNMLQTEATNYLNNMSTLSHMTKMCSSLGAHWPVTGHNIESILATTYTQAKTDSDKAAPAAFNSSYDGRPSRLFNNDPRLIYFSFKMMTSRTPTPGKRRTLATARKILLTTRRKVREAPRKASTAETEPRSPLFSCTSWSALLRSRTIRTCTAGRSWPLR